MEREITIAGGGLAGLSLGIGLRAEGVGVTVLEAGNYPRHRVCGEFISGVSAGTLEALGIRDDFRDAAAPRSLGWYERGRLLHRDFLPEPAMAISRHLLDDRLVRRLVAAGGVVKTGHRDSPHPREGLVWAAGRRPCDGPWIGLKAHFRGLDLEHDLEMHAGANGYAGLVTVEDGWTNVCGLFRLDRRLQAPPGKLLAANLGANGNRQLASALNAAEMRDHSFTAVAGFRLGRQAPMPGMLALGDAGSMIPPFTGNGMTMAFQAAEMAVAPLANWARGRQSWQNAVNIVRTSIDKTFRRRLAVAGVLHAVLMDRSGRSLVQSLAAANVLPFRPLLGLVR